MSPAGILSNVWLTLLGRARKFLGVGLSVEKLSPVDWVTSAAHAMRKSTGPRKKTRSERAKGLLGVIKEVTLYINITSQICFTYLLQNMAVCIWILPSCQNFQIFLNSRLHSHHFRKYSFIGAGLLAFTRARLPFKRPLTFNTPVEIDNCDQPSLACSLHSTFYQFDICFEKVTDPFLPLILFV